MLVDEIERRQNVRLEAQRIPAHRGAVDVDIASGYSAITAVAMFCVNAVLAYVARDQYFQPVSAMLVMKDAWVALPLFYVLARWFRLGAGKYKQLIGCFTSCILGAYIVYIFNDQGYYASMSMAPGLGTLWVWLFTELEWYFGVLSLLVVGAYVHIKNYSIV